MGKDGAAGGGSAAQLGTGNGNWPPRTWHSYNATQGSRPRSVEGGARTLDPRAAAANPRRNTYYGQPAASDPRLVLQTAPRNGTDLG